MSYDSDGLAQVLVDGHWFYVKRDGSHLAVVTFDNGADNFEEGLVRSVQDHRIVYFDASFARVVPPRYDWGWPFENGRALVCNGCKEGPPDDDGHTAMTGGLWGYIDRSGHEVVPVTLTESEVRRR